MDKGYEKERFESISIKTSVAKKFRKYSRGISKSQSMALLLMIEFFEDNSISPYESLGVNMTTLESKIKSRINALIAIIKDIEKHQIKPTNAMIQLLFKEAAEEEEEQILLEEVLSDTTSEAEFTENTELEYYRNGYFTGKSSLREVKDEFKKVLDKVDFIKNSFGSNYYRLNVTQQEFEEIKQKLS